MSYDINSNITTKTGYTAVQLQAAASAMNANNGFNDFQGFVDAENNHGLNSLFALAHAAVESAWGTSYYSRTRNNLFGFNAVDSDPDQASYYANQGASIDFYASFLQKYYLTPGAVYYNGDTPHGVFVKYSSSHDAEANTVVQIMNSLEAHITGGSQPDPTPAPQPTPADNPAAGTYHVNSGENLTEISSKYAGTNPDLWVRANINKYPRITSNYIQAGWDLNIPGGTPGAATPAPASAPGTYVNVPSGYDGYLSVLGPKYGSTPEQIVEWNKEKYPSITTDYVQAGWNIRVA